MRSTQKILKHTISGFCLCLLSMAAHAQASETQVWLLGQKLPDWAYSSFEKLNLDSLYQLSDFINPYYLEADYNGDAKTDIAIAIEQRGTGKRGFVILHQGGENYYVIGAGKSFSNGGDNFDWMDIWKVYSDSKMNPGAGEKVPVELKGKAIYVAKSESASAIIYWTGSKYKWYQQGD